MINPSNTQNNTPDDPFDIRDESMELDDAIANGTAQDNDPDPPTPEASNWQSELVSKARAAGLPSSVIDRLQGVDAVNDLISIISSGMQKESVEPEVRVSNKKVAEFELDVDEATAFDPDAARAMKSMNEYYSNRIARLEQMVESSNKNPGGVPAFVSNLAPEWREVFGTNDKPNDANLRKFDESVETIRAGYIARHRRVPADAELFKMALSASFNDRQSEIARSQLSNKVSKRSDQMVSRPGTRTAQSSNSRVRAAQGVSDWFKSRGIDPNGASDDVFS